MSYLKSLYCENCQQSYSHMQATTCCPTCHGQLDALYDYEKLHAEFDLERALRRPETIWRWREWLPVAESHNIVSLGEGGTPLIECTRLAHRIGIARVLVKYEALNPTGSFKDRSFSVAVSKAVENGILRGFTSSTGNAGASFAAYAAAAGLQALVLVNAWATPEKLAMIQAYGPRLACVTYGDSEALRELIDRVAQELGLFEFTNFVNPFRHEGLKTYAYEIALQMGWNTPDRVIFPTGTGGGVSGCWKGFRELFRFGVIKNLPRMTLVQPESCAPIVAAFRKGERVAGRHGSLGTTIAQSIALNAPLFDARRPLSAIYESLGYADTVSDGDILEATRLLGEQGIFTEPAGAASVAVARNLARDGLIDPHETVVCVVTATGLKQPEAVREIHKAPQPIPLESLEAALRDFAIGGQPPREAR